MTLTNTQTKGKMILPTLSRKHKESNFLTLLYIQTLLAAGSLLFQNFSLDNTINSEYCV